ncbi:hypothetical protein Bbelb_272500 [Branchiostoma belcheri]|nr:hypothetical protein Bbelb_272500 [Branchiostoma belcheri]
MSTMECVAAEGLVLPPLVTFSKSYPSSAYRLEGPDNALYSTTPSGFIEVKVFVEWLKKCFCRFASPERPVLLLMDQHTAHLTTNAIYTAVDNDIILMGLPPHTSHILQPLDAPVDLLTGGRAETSATESAGGRGRQGWDFTGIVFIDERSGDGTESLLVKRVREIPSRPKEYQVVQIQNSGSSSQNSGSSSQNSAEFWLQFPEFWLQFPEFWLQLPEEFWLQFPEFWLQFPEFCRIGPTITQTLASMQKDTMDELLSSRSEACRGILSQLKSYFSHRSLKKNVQDNVQHVWDMIDFATCAYTCLLAADICKMGNVQDTPADFPTSANNPAKQFT